MSINWVEKDATKRALTQNVRPRSFDLRLCCEIHPTTEE